jgi:hypothetical protein
MGLCEVLVNRSRLSWVGLASLAVALLLACSIDDRKLTRASGALSPEAGPPGQGTGGSGSVELRVVPSAVDLGAVTQGFAARARLRVSNSGSTPLAAPVVGWASGSNADLTLIQNQCTARLAPGEACDLRVQVVPSGVGALQGTLEIASAGASNVALPVTANGLEPGPLVIQPAAGSFQDFGGVRVGGAAEGTFTVSNPGAVASGVLSFAFNRPEFALGPAAAGACVLGVTDLASGESCNVRLAFSPAERGPLEATFSVSSTAAGSRSLTLRGQGLVPSALQVSAPLLAFGGVVPGDTASLDLEVENSGDDSLTLAGAQLSPADVGVFRIADGNCGEGVVLLGGERCRMQLDYRPEEEGKPSAGELLVAAAGGEPSQRIALQGVALTRGNLLVEAIEAGQEEFGDVLLGESATRVFRVSNPAQQPSGALSLSGRNGFEVQPPSGEGACESGITALGNGQSCTARVSFAPASRGARVGALTVDSLLAGAKSLALRGRGVSAGVLEIDSGTADALVDFGRVTTGSSATRTLSVRNGGDQLLAAPELRVTGSSPDQAAAFSYDSGCSEALAGAAECEVVLRFAPAAVVPYAASLEFVAASGQRANVLLLGEALEPGRLVLAPAQGASPDFGDVAMGRSLSRSFSVTNPGGGASGALSVRTDDSQFVVQAAACATGPSGLADGESCTFDVTFVPTTNSATEARLSVQSAAGGETGIALSGRGRLPAALAASATERDLGRANLGQPSGPANEFTWTLNNTGDLPSGTLAVTNQRPEDFDITADTCSSGPVAGGGSCAITIVFAPDAAGNRATRITVTDAASNQEVPLQVTGFGVQLAEPGERCLATSDCSEGVCTAGVCCNQECSLTCQSCSTGQCQAQSAQQRCGNSGGVCFGVEQCALPAGGGCTTSAQCGGNLECKQCQGGGSQCTAPEDCCGGCGAGAYQCVGGECGCPLQAGGLQQIDCGGGLCAVNRAGACCPGSPPANCNCDPTDNLCKECLQNNQCTSGPANSVGQCNTNRTCSYSCLPGFKKCNDTCIANAACCGGCPAGQQCPNGQCLVNAGGACSAGGAACASGNCSGGRCCNTGCTGGCFPDGTCGCPAGMQFARGQCRAGSGASCSGPQDTATCAGTCVGFFVDADGDSFGDRTRPVAFCGSPPLNVNPPVVANADDCCDASNFVKPRQSQASISFDRGDCPATWKINDFDCDGVVSYRSDLRISPTGSCSDADNPGIPCAQRSNIFAGPNNPLGFLQDNIFENGDVNGDATQCGNSSLQYETCAITGGSCQATISLGPPCH